MEFMLQEHHHQVRETARRFADEVVAPQARATDESEEFPTAIVKQMGELGFMGLPYPEQYGGAGLHMLAYAIAVEEIARACGSTANTLAAQGSLACGPGAQNGTQGPNREVHAPIADGHA